ncbi:MAG: L,D-transpeptidase family protein, partial [Gemmatimonadetes bacterium]|nr:L,D-transpeptidase family protein [Gemmatimonadota bacterium]
DPAAYDSAMARAVERFQRRHGIVPDGTVGAETRAAMNVPVEDRIRSIKLNLDRWRWLPRDLGEHFVMVNVAGQEMAVVRDGEPALTMNVIIGEVANQTPIFQDTMEHIVVNPYWNVPQSIAEEELWPKVERDPTYLARNDYEVVGSGDARRIRQKPGRSNALGHVKFLFPNDLNIYLHDTPTGHLFSRSARAFSHGCIRLERPDDLARYLFTHATDRGADEYDALRARSTEQWVNLSEKLPVYVLYFTAWADEEGNTRFYPDVYARDRAMDTLARAKLDGEADAAAGAVGAPAEDPGAVDVAAGGAPPSG